MNLLDLVKQQLTPTVVNSIASYLGDTSQNTSTALSGAMPAILGGIIEKDSTPKGANDILDLIQTGGYDGSTLGNLVNTVGDRNSMSKMIAMGSTLMNTFFGGRSDLVANNIAKLSGLSSDNSGTLLSIAAPILMNVLGKQVTSQRMGVSGLTSLLQSQKDYVKAALPAGMSGILNLNALGNAADSAKTKVDNSIEAVNRQADDTGMPRFLIWLLIGGLLLALIYFWRSCREEKEVVENTTVEVMIDSTDIETATSRTLPSGTVLNFDDESIENDLIDFIEDPSRIVDKTTWFNFRDLRFETGSAKIDSTSMKEVDNIAEIMQAFPNVSLKVGGYTDNTGSAEVNKKLSGERAANVVKALEAKGVDASRLESEGYGPEYAVASNDTEEGRAQNRRIAVRVIKK